MITIQINRTSPLPCGASDIRDFTLNHSGFYFLTWSGDRVMKWAKCAHAAEVITLERKYACFCYDGKEHCFWAASPCSTQTIYRLDLSFREVGHLTLRSPLQQCATSLCCDGCGEGLWITYPCHLAYLEKWVEQATWFENQDKRRINLGVLAQCDCRAVSYFENGRHFIELLSPCAQEPFEFCVPKQYTLVGVAPCPRDTGCDGCNFYMLLSGACSHELQLAECCIAFGELQLGSCCAPDPCCQCAHCRASYEVMHAIALEETGLSHILNAEGDKLQKAVAICDNIEQLICVNDSVKRTLTQVMLLEGQLYCKLETLVSGCGACRGPDAPC